MNKAILTDINVESADFSSVILIITANVGYQEAPTLGFTPDSNSRIQSAIKDSFSPEFRNRLDAIIAFKPLNKQEILKIVDKNIQDLNQQIANKNIEVILDKNAKEYLAQICFNQELGERPLALKIQEKIKNTLSDLMLFGELQKGGKITFSHSNQSDTLQYLIFPNKKMMK